MTANLLAQLIERAAGLSINRGGVNDKLERFVTERMRALGIRRLEDYVVLAADPSRPEQRRLIEQTTVQHTWFYRDPEQLHAIATLLGEAPPGPVAVWVAGCATGEEAYTIAMIGRSVKRDVRVLATDINETALEAARRGVYTKDAVRDVPVPEQRWLSRRDDGFLVTAELRANVKFQRHNLVDLPPPGLGGGWDLIVCRNVLIYFAQAPAARVFARFAQAVREGGSVVVGASEIVLKPPPGLEFSSMGTRLVLRRPLGRDARSVPPPPRALANATPGALPVITPPVAARLRPSQLPGGDDDLVAALSRGHALFEHGEFAAAIAVYSELATRYAAIAEPWLFLGLTRFANNEFDGAVEALRASLCLDERLWPAGFHLARALERLGRYAEARQQYDLLAGGVWRPFVLQSSSALINELRAFEHDIRAAARHATERCWPL